jgi:hypothetical protein
MRRGLRVAALFLAAAAVPVCAEETAASRAVGDYARFELRDVIAKGKVPPEAMAKINAGLKLKLTDPIERWNRAGTQPGRAGALAIEVVIIRIKYVTAEKRFWVGAFAGDSRAAGIARLVEVDSGRELHRRQFMEEAGGHKGASTKGASDDAVLDRFAAAIGNWVIAVHDRSDVLQSEIAGTAATN